MTSKIDPEMFGIRYLAPKGRMPGYLVKLERNRQLHHKWFGQARYDSLAAALVAAKAWRDEVAPTLPGVTKQEFVSIVRPNNTSGVPGVLRMTRRSKTKQGGERLLSYWIARPPKGLKVPARYFSISRYGEEKAKAHAVQVREAYVAMCDGFHLAKTPAAFLPVAAATAGEAVCARLSDEASRA